MAALPKFRSTAQPSAAAVARRQNGSQKPEARGRKSEVELQASAFNVQLQRILRKQAMGNWMMPSVATVTPQYIETILRGALGGNHVQQWELFDLMEDTWPRLLKDLGELKGAVVGMDWKLEAWAEEDKPPTDTALERKKLVSNAVWQMRPAADSDDNAFEQTIFDILDAWAKGVSVLEVIWEQRRVGQLGDLTVPQCTAWAHPRNYAWSDEGFLGLNVQNEISTNIFAGGSRANASHVERFPENKFLVAISKAKSGPPLTASLLRPLAWWWCAANFSSDWLMNLAQLFGIPFRWATYADNAKTETVDQINDLLANMGSNGYGAFPEGTNLNFLEGGKNAGSSPQADLLERADKACDLLILGQTLTSETGNSGAGGGSLALGKVHAGVRTQIIQNAANFAARVLNQQLVPAILRENYGDEEEAPYFCPEFETQKDLTATATMIQTAVETGFKVPEKWAHAELNIPLPQAGEKIIEQPERGLQPASPPNDPSAAKRPEGRAPAEEDAAALEARSASLRLSAANAAEKKFLEAVATKKDAALALLARITDIEDDAAMLTALNNFYREMPSLTALITADVTRQQRALEQITAPALADGLQGKTP